MKRLSKKDIQAAVEKLKNKPESQPLNEQQVGKLPPKMSSQRIRKKGI